MQKHQKRALPSNEEIAKKENTTTMVKYKLDKKNHP
jgi:hypothetical protein